MKYLMLSLLIAIFGYNCVFLDSSEYRCEKYTIIEDWSCTFPEELIEVLIQDIETKKYTCYVFSYLEFSNPVLDPCLIVATQSPASLEYAKISFDEYELTEQNYGF